MTRRHHDAAVHFLEERSEIDDFRAAQADVVNVYAGVEQALLERLAERLARQPDVAVDLLAVEAAEVVRLESGNLDFVHL